MSKKQPRGKPFPKGVPEDHRRRYAALEALKIGFGGIAYVSRVLGMSRCTIYTGIRELEEMRNDDPEHPGRPSGDAKRIRRPGGGRPKITERHAGLEATVGDILEAHSAGSPTDETVRWTDLKPLELAQELLQRGYEIGRNTAAQLLERAGYRRRSLRKELITFPSPIHPLTITRPASPLPVPQPFRASPGPPGWVCAFR